MLAACKAAAPFLRPTPAHLMHFYKWTRVWQVDGSGGIEGAELRHVVGVGSEGGREDRPLVPECKQQ